MTIKSVKENSKKRITDYQLCKEDIRPEVVRRWIEKNYGMTFQAYRRMYGISIAYQEWRKGKNTTHTAFNSGYESFNGFGYIFTKLIANSPVEMSFQSAGQQHL